MPVSTRPTGIKVSNYVYSDKENAYGKLKQFLFDTDSGRTDVLFFASAGSAYEGNDWKFDIDGPDAYHYTGGLIDGIAKAILQGSATRTPRQLYGTGIYPGYSGNKIPNFDAWNNTTWWNANTNGVGGYLAGSSSYFDSWIYLNDGVKKTSGLHVLCNSGTNLTSWNEEAGENLSNNYFVTFRNTFYDGNATLNSASSTKKLEFWLAQRCLPDSDVVVSTVNNSLLSTTIPCSVTSTTTPEQPQRFWNKEQPWAIEDSTQKYLPIGIGYLDTTTNTVSTVFSNATTYGYVPNGFQVGMTLSQVQSLIPANELTLLTVQDNGSLDSSNPVIGSLGNLHMYDASLMTAEQKNYLLGRYSTKKIIAKLFNFNEIISLLNLNILSNNSTINSYANWKSVDGFRSGNKVLFRSQFKNTETAIQNDLNSFVTFWNNNVAERYGLCTSTTSGASDWQIGKPILFYWGTRDGFISNSGWNNSELAFPRNFASGTSSFLYNTGSIIKGFPITLSTLSPCGWFTLTNEFTSNISSANPSTELFKNKGIIIKTDLGLFLDTIETKGGGNKQPTGRSLTTAEKNNILGIFKSNNFKYVVNAYVMDKYSNEAGSSNASQLDAGNIAVTIQSKPVGNSTFSVLSSQNFNTLSQVTIPENSTSSTITRRNTYNRLVKIVDLSTANASWQISQLKLGFLGSGISNKTKGNFSISSHYGVDANCTNGIAFSRVSTSYSFRSGDEAYKQNGSYAVSGRNAIYTDLFLRIKERQTDPSLGGNNTKKKLVIFFECGVWELANTSFTYNGINTYQYLIDRKPGQSALANGNINLYGGSFRTTTEIINCALLAGFTRDEIVICYYTPAQLTKVTTQSKGTFDGLTLNSEADENAYTANKNLRSSFTRASEIFENTFLASCGLFNACPPNTIDNVTNPASQNAMYINLGTINSINSLLANQITGWESDWYHRYFDEDDTRYNCYSETGSLAIGSLLMDYVAAETATVNFVPTWLPIFSSMLGYSTDPVSGSDFAFVTPSLDISDDTAYMLEYDQILNNPSNPAYTQASNTISLVKHKILQ